MSYSRTSLRSISWLKLNSNLSLSFIHTVSKKNNFNNNFLIQKQLSNLHCGNTFIPSRTTYRLRYTFVYQRKPFVNGSLVHSYRENSSGKQADLKPNVEEPVLNKSQADDLILRLTESERQSLLAALQEFNSNQIKTEYEAEKGPPPTKKQLLRVCIYNAVPFVGFGFLDNFIMIVAGDYIDESLGSLVTMSTMAAAALGNTISDVMGIGSAWYVETAASKIGLKPPNLSPIQLDMRKARIASNLGRVFGIIVGCLLGMMPLLFMNKETGQKKDKN